MPVILESENNMIILPVDYTQKTIDRDLVRLTRIDFYNVEAYLYIQNAGAFAAVIKAEPNRRGRHDCIAKLDFVPFILSSDAVTVSDFFEKKPSQVEGVVVDQVYRGGELACSMYEYLVCDHGITIVSDSEQYAGGLAIWKKLAKESSKLNVYAFDVDEVAFIKDANGENLVYDGENIEDETLWSLEPDRSREQIVLVARKVSNG